MLNPSNLDTVDARGSSGRDTVDTVDSPGVAEGQRLEQLPVKGEVIGRYLVVGELGSGAMGVVLAAYDPELDRKVALKLIKGSATERARARLQREAQALAKLGHPNVVAVHDVGTHHGRLFVGMEFVEGETLGEWMDASVNPRPWREVLEVFMAAGRGLAAAHAAKLIHRDFKPDNVMLGSDGRARVMDFGLARGQRESDAGGPPAESAGESAVESATEPGKGRPGQALSRSRSAVLDSALTQTGAMLGTPAYMPLEQFAGEPADARSDQFGFCASLYEALYGERPFAGDSYGTLVDALAANRVEPPPRGSDVPGWVRAAVVRGLHSDPARRWPSMDELLEALGRDPSVRRRWWLGAAALVALLGGGAWGLSGDAEEAEPSACTAMDEGLVGVWDQARREELRAAFEASTLSYAADTLGRVEGRLDAYAQDWVQGREAACLAKERGEQSDRLFDLRMTCLDQRRAALDATLIVLGEGGDALVRKATKVAGGLPSLARCEDAEALLAEVPPPEDAAVAAKVEALGRRYEQARAYARAGNYGDAQAMIDPVVAEAEVLGYDPFLARALLSQGSIRSNASDHEGAEASFRAGFDLAVESKMGEQAALGSSLMMFLLATRLDRSEEARVWAGFAESLARAEGTPAALGRYYNQLGGVAKAERDYAEARAAYERALAIRRELLGERHPQVAGLYLNLGVIAFLTSDYAEAQAKLDRALELTREVRGPEHPDTARVLDTLGGVTFSKGDLSLAKQHYEEALAIRLEALGPEHLDTGTTCTNLANVERDLGAFDRAQALFEQALDIRKAHYGEEHALVAGVYNNLGILSMRRGDFDAATRQLERALALYVAAKGPDYPKNTKPLTNLASIARRQGDYAAARGYLERALTIAEASSGPEHSKTLSVLSSLGQLSEAEGRYAEARRLYAQVLELREAKLGPDEPKVGYSLMFLARARLGAGGQDARELDETLAMLERAEQILEPETGDLPRQQLAEAYFVHAQALWDAPAGRGRDRDRALELAQLSRARWAETKGDAREAKLEQLETWLDARR